MDHQRSGPLWEAIRLAAAGAPKEEFLAKAMEAKEEIVSHVYDLHREVTILDNLVARIAPEVKWETGWSVTSRATVSGSLPRQTTPTRSRRALEIASKLVADGATAVSARAIAEVLGKEGFQGSVRDLTISAGNVLARAEGWRRIRRGEYEPVQ